MGEDRQDNSVAMQATRLRVVGMILFSAFVVSWFVWGPPGLVYYAGGRFNSLLIFMLTYPFAVAALLAVILLPVLIVRSIVHWRRLSKHAKVHSSLVVGALIGLVASVGVGLAGIVPSPFDTFVRGFTRYVENRADVAAVQNWLSSLDPNEYIGANMDSGGIPISPTEYPRAIVRLHPLDRPHGVRVTRDDTGKLVVRLTWGGGFIGHWGIEVGDKSMEPPPDSEVIGYRPLAPGTWVWYERN